MARRTAVDPHAKRELELFIDNTEAQYRNAKRAEEALARVICRKKGYNVDLAARVFAPVMNNAAKAYSREYSTGHDGLTMFSAATRQALAKEYAADFKERVNGFLRGKTQDVTDVTAVTLTKCKVSPLAGRVRRRRR